MVFSHFRGKNFDNEIVASFYVWENILHLLFLDYPRYFNSSRSSDLLNDKFFLVYGKGVFISFTVEFSLFYEWKGWNENTSCIPEGCKSIGVEFLLLCEWKGWNEPFCILDGVFLLRCYCHSCTSEKREIKMPFCM